MIDPKELLSFETLITPKVITVLYWLALAAIVIAGVIAMLLRGFFPGLLFIVIAAIVTRISFERTIVAFKSNEYLKQIAERK